MNCTLPGDEANCAYVTDHAEACGDTNSIIPYLRLYYCEAPGAGGLVLITLYVLMIFAVLGSTSERFFCAALMQLTERLRLSPNVAGVTLLALGNGAPDIFSSYAAVSTGALNQALGELVGAGIFVSTCVVGSVILFSTDKSGVRPTRRPFIRDTVFFIGGVCLVIGVLYDAKVTLGESIMLLSYYVIYVVAVFFGRYIFQNFVKTGRLGARFAVMNNDPPVDDPFSEGSSDPLLAPHERFATAEIPAFGEKVSGARTLGSKAEPSSSAMDRIVSHDDLQHLMSEDELSQIGRDVEVGRAKREDFLRSTMEVLPGLDSSRPTMLVSTDGATYGSRLRANAVSKRNDQLKHEFTSEDVFLPRVGFYNRRHHHHTLEEELGQMDPSRHDRLRGAGLLGALIQATAPVVGIHARQRPATLNERRDFGDTGLIQHRQPRSRQNTERHLRPPSMRGDDQSLIGIAALMSEGEEEEVASQCSSSEEEELGDASLLVATSVKGVRPSERSFEYWKDYFDWTDMMPWYSKAMFIVQFPITVLQVLTIPWVEEGKYSRILTAIQPLICSVVVFALFGGDTRAMGWVWGVVAAAGAFASAAVTFWITRPVKRAMLVRDQRGDEDGAGDGLGGAPGEGEITDIQVVDVVEQPPILAGLYVVIALFMSVVWIYVAANELVVVLQAAGFILHISNAVLGLTVLAWGNSVADLISNTVVSRKGYPSMALGACTAAPLCNLLLGLGIALAIYDFKFQRYQVLGEDGGPPVANVVIMGAFVLLLALMMVLVAVPLSGFVFPKWLGVVLILIYAAFTGMGLLMEFGVILDGVSLFDKLSTEG